MRKLTCPECGRRIADRSTTLAAHKALHAERPDDPTWAALTKQQRNLKRKEQKRDGANTTPI